MLRNIRLLYIHNFLTDFCPQWPFLVIYFADMTGSYMMAMSVLALETLAAALFDIPTGIFSDHVGRRLTMASGSLCSALGLVCYASAQGIGILYAGAVLTGLGQCLFSGNNNALLYESLQSEGLEKQYHHYRGGTGSMFQLALSLSAFLSIWLSHFGLQIVFVCAIVPQIAGIFVSLLFQEPRLHTQTRQKGFSILKRACIKTWNNPHLLGLVIAKSVSYGAGEAKFKFQSAYVNALWPIWGVGLYRSLNHALSFVGYRMAGRAIERFGEAYVFIARDIYWFISQMVALAIGTFISPLMILTGAIFFGPGEVASDHLMQKEFTNDERATMGSIASFATSIIFAISAVGIGAISDRFGVTIGLGVGVCLGFMAMPVNVWLFRRELGFDSI
jgi:MFS family permease